MIWCRQGEKSGITPNFISWASGRLESPFPEVRRQWQGNSVKFEFLGLQGEMLGRQRVWGSEERSKVKTDIWKHHSAVGVYCHDISQDHWGGRHEGKRDLQTKIRKRRRNQKIKQRWDSQWERRKNVQCITLESEKKACSGEESIHTWNAVEVTAALWEWLIKYTKCKGTSLLVCWLRPQLPMQGPDSIPGQGTRSHTPQWRVCMPQRRPGTVT